MRNDPFQRAAVQAHAIAIGQRPAKARGRKAEGGCLRKAGDFLHREEARKLRANAVMERVAGRENAGRLATAGEDDRIAVRKGTRPSERLRGKRGGEVEMARSADHEFSLIETSPSRRGKPRAPILT